MSYRGSDCHDNSVLDENAIIDDGGTDGHAKSGNGKDDEKRWT